MPLKIDSPTLAKWKESGTDAVRVRFVGGWCAGTKISVAVAESDDFALPSFDMGGVIAHFDESDRAKLENARLTRIEKNGREVWMYAASAVKWRCGCGSSFTFDADAKPVSKHSEAKVPKFDPSKLAALKSAFVNKKKSRRNGGFFTDSEIPAAPDSIPRAPQSLKRDWKRLFKDRRKRL